MTPRTTRPIALASAAAKVWRACDGTKDVPALAESLALSVDDVTRALESWTGLSCSRIRACRSSPTATATAPTANGLTRRELGRRSAKVGAAVAAAPMLYSIAVPSPAAAQGSRRRTSQCALFSHEHLRYKRGSRSRRRLLLLLSKDRPARSVG